MDPGTLVLLHSPLVGVESWGALPAVLRRGGVAVLAERVDGDDRRPYARRYVARAADGVLQAIPGPAATCSATPGCRGRAPAGWTCSPRRTRRWRPGSAPSWRRALPHLDRRRPGAAGSRPGRAGDAAGLAAAGAMLALLARL
jgi:hypothetical protein